MEMPPCKVCGSTATKVRVLEHPGGTFHIYLCQHHEFVCTPHLADPCDICDSE